MSGLVSVRGVWLSFAAVVASVLLAACCLLAGLLTCLPACLLAWVRACLLGRLRRCFSFRLFACVRDCVFPSLLACLFCLLVPREGFVFAWFYFLFMQSCVCVCFFCDDRCVSWWQVYQKDSGLNITATEQLQYNTWLAAQVMNQRTSQPTRKVFRHPNYQVLIFHTSDVWHRSFPFYDLDPSGQMVGMICMI